MANIFSEHNGIWKIAIISLKSYTNTNSIDHDHFETRSFGFMPADINVLVVEDDDDIREVILNTLNESHRFAEIKTVVNGLDALDIVREHKIDLVISDIAMPKMSGIEFLTACQNEGLGEMVTIVLTGVATVENAINALKLGAFDFLEKPIEYDEFSDSIRMAVEYIQKVRTDKASQDIHVKGNIQDFHQQNKTMLQEVHNGLQVKANLSGLYRNLVRIQQILKHADDNIDEILLVVHQFRLEPENINTEDLEKLEKFQKSFEQMTQLTGSGQ